MITPSLCNPVMVQGKYPENLIPADKRKFEGWIAFNGSSVTLTQGQNVSEWGTTQATRIQTSGGASKTKYYFGFGVNRLNNVSISVKVKNIGTNPVVVTSNAGAKLIVVAPGETKHFLAIVTTTDIGDMQINFQTQVNISDSLDFYAFDPIAIPLPITSFSFSRTSCAFTPDGRLEMPNNMRLVAGKFGLAGMVEEAATNLLPAGSDKKLTLLGTSSFARHEQTEGAFSGWQRINLTALDANKYIAYLPVIFMPVGKTCTYSIDFFSPSGKVSCVIAGGYLAGNLIKVSGYRMALTVTNDTASAKYLGVYFTYPDGALLPGDYFYYRGYMVTETPYPLTFTDSTRAAEVLTLPTAGVWVPGNWQVDMVVTPMVDLTKVPPHGRLFYIRNDANNVYTIYGNNGNGRLIHVVLSNGASATVTSSSGVQVGVPTKVTIKGNGATTCMVVDGTKVGEVAYTEPLGVLGSSMYFGTNYLGTSHFNALFEHIRVGTARSDAEIIASHAVTSNPFPIDAQTTAKIDFNQITYRKARCITL